LYIWWIVTDLINIPFFVGFYSLRYFYCIKTGTRACFWSECKCIWWFCCTFAFIKTTKIKFLHFLQFDKTSDDNATSTTEFEISTTSFRFNFFYVVFFKTSGIFVITMVCPLSIMVSIFIDIWKIKNLLFIETKSKFCFLLLIYFNL